MDPISAIVTALALGASAGLKDTASQAVKEAYSGLRDLLKSRFPAVNIEQLEQAPDSKNRRGVLTEELQRGDAQNEADLAAKAQELIDLIEHEAPHTAPAIGVTLEDVRAANIRLREIVASGGAVVVKGAIATGDIEISNVQAGIHDPAKKA
jgi:hypothetical protein